MKILYFDMEFANGQVKGSIYSMGYLMTDENFNLLTPPTDLIINPDCAWNEYVEHKILAYPKEKVESQPTFPEVYEKIKALFDEAEIAVGFAADNDTRELRQDCDRYGLPQIQFPYLDLKPLCKSDGKYRFAHGLAGYVKAYCGFDPKNQHRSDGDAYATMKLFEALCKAKHATPDMMIAAYPECCGEAVPVVREKKKKSRPQNFHRRRRYGKKSPPAQQPSTKA